MGLRRPRSDGAGSVGRLTRFEAFLDRHRIGVSVAVVGTVAILALAVLAIYRLGGPSQPSSRHQDRYQATAADVRATKDRFGIRYLQPTRPLGMYWRSDWGKDRSFTGVDPDDPWFDANHGSASYRVHDGQLLITGEIPRMYIHDPTLHKQWRDVEITMYFKRVSDRGVPYAGMTAVARSNHLETQSGANECDTRGIGARLRYDGHTDFEKETAFPLNEAVNDKQLWQSGMPYNEWIGFKYLVYDKPDGVHMETWVDTTDGKHGGDWQQVNEMVDNGHMFGNVPCAPHINPQLALTSSTNRPGSESGKPNATVYFRSDQVNKDGLVYKWGSVREIQPR